MELQTAQKLATTLVKTFNSVNAAHSAYKRVMENNCPLESFKKLLVEEYTVLSIDSENGRIHADYISARTSHEALLKAAESNERYNSEFIAAVTGKLKEGSDIHYAGDSLVDACTIKELVSVFGPSEVIDFATRYESDGYTVCKITVEGINYLVCANNGSEPEVKLYSMQLFLLSSASYSSTFETVTIEREGEESYTNSDMYHSEKYDSDEELANKIGTHLAGLLI